MHSRPIVLMACLVFGLAVPAFAHETGVIRLDAKTLAVGAEMGIRGKKFTMRIQLDLELRGTLKTYKLKQVETDTLGAFRLRIALPADAAQGKYTVVAVASDGDDVGQAILVIVAATSPVRTDNAAQPMPGMDPGMGGHMMMPAGHEAHPSAEPMKVDVRTSPAQRFTIFTLIAFGLAGGTLLLMIGRRSEL